MAIAVIFHLIALVHFYFGLYYDQIYMTGPDTEWRKYKFGGRLSEKFFSHLIKKFVNYFFFFSVYLTIWNLVSDYIIL